jgi:isopenicillin-N N-acyltransferase-like protein
MAKFERVVISGTPRERGRSYGSQCKQKIQAVLDNYRKLFSDGKTYASWETARQKAMELVPEIDDLGSELTDEMRGIAEGAGVDFEDIVTLNCRSEILALTPSDPDDHECSACAVLPERSENGHLLVAQNWDMLHWVGENGILLEILREDGPDVFAITEAGQLARYGMNQNGCVLSLTSLPGPKVEKLYGTPSVPLRRKYLMEGNWVDGYGHIFERIHMRPMHYLIGCGEDIGEALSVEAFPEGKYIMYAENGILAHSNHPLSSRPQPLPNQKFGSTIYRCDILRRQLEMKEKNNRDDLYKALTCRFAYPFCITGQRDERLPDMRQGATLACFVMDATEKRLWARKGNNMDEPLEEYPWTRPEKVKK